MSSESRSRTISFRLSEEEYEQVRQVCLTQGIPSVSEMARVAISLLLQQPDRLLDGSFEVRLREMERRLQFLTVEVKRLCPAMQCSQPSAVAD